MKQSSATNKGFSLVEISLVILFIGILVGAVTVGSSMIKSSTLRGIEADVAKYSTAITLFRNKMNALPGDFRKASTYWSGATDGNGNAKIGYNNGLLDEEYYVWDHLSSAGLIAGDYSGSLSVPASVMSGGYYRVSYQEDIYTSSGHMISINAMNPLFGVANSAILSPSDVYSMDKKSDDGLADSGKIMGFNEQAIPGCVTNDYTVGSGTYLSTSDSIKCKIFFVIDQ